MTILFSREQELLISVVFVFLAFLYMYSRSSSRSHGQSVLPADWPIVHMLPGVIANLHNAHDYFAAILTEAGHNFRLHIPQRHIFLTCDPGNVRHIFTTNHANFPKGLEFAAIFDIMDGGIFTVDGEPWRRQRTKFQSVLSSPGLVSSMAACCRDKVENGLLPFFTDMASTNTPFDMQEVISRFVFDLAATPLFGVDPSLLSSDMPSMDVAVAMDTVMEVGFFRHVMPASCWKAMRRLNIGPERKLDEAHKVIRGFFMEMIEKKKINGTCVCINREKERVDVLSSYINDPDYADDDLLRAKLLSLMLGGRDTIGTTLPWIFYILAKNPNIVSIIRNELSPIASHKVAMGKSSMVIFEPEETKHLVYLKAALYETLRLYPSAPIERKTVATADIMPSGHEVHTGDTILISLYSMARMEGVWGKDCRDYNPHRWLSEDGNKLVYVPSHKFLSFNSGPRMCPGKDIAVVQMKTVVAAVVWNFDMEVVEGQSIQPKLSCTLQMKNGLMMILKKREI
ncbi:Cytochrome P450 86B1 [Triticum urartu]|uniref:Cytochrome P450 86B1 n=1 Tax=Triticum urartu TaxID=4572 RepID=M7Z045_TRIUA|nr:noroxomaritidine synthase-like [Triticum urartu]EMS56473.1 Cytochrome P450 86B1 [Triticum urartu]